jgi:hypothetical protein
MCLEIPGFPSLAGTLVASSPIVRTAVIPNRLVQTSSSLAYIRIAYLKRCTCTSFAGACDRTRNANSFKSSISDLIQRWFEPLRPAGICALLTANKMSSSRIHNTLASALFRGFHRHISVPQPEAERSHGHQQLDRPVSALPSKLIRS